jgi:DNA-binding LacI/PurR family transcriptional regulator
MGVKIPEDLSIVGFDDTDMRALIYPKMTAVCQDSRMLGQVAFERLLDRLAGREDSAPTVRGQAAWLEINETTAPPPEIAYHILPNRTRLASASRSN